MGYIYRMLSGGRISKDDLRSGDHIFSWRDRAASIYAHHGIYIGDGMVIHYTPRAGQKTGSSFLSSSAPNTTIRCPVCGDQSNSGGVIKSCLDCFLSGGRLCRFRYLASFFHYFLNRPLPGINTCTRAASDPSDTVLHRANNLLNNNGFGTYNMFENNCVHFALYCKTGSKIAF